MFEAFSAGYYVGRFYIDAYDGAHAVMDRDQHEEANEQVYATGEGVERAVDDSRMESLMAPVYGDLFSEDHGELTCLAKCFENVIEMNFVLADGVGGRGRPGCRGAGRQSRAHRRSP